MRLLAGLGNPGSQYAQTRHNAGFWLVDKIAATQGASWKEFKGGELAQVAGGFLFKPKSFMNHSGLPLRQALDFYKIGLDGLCVAADDVYLAPGSARIRRTGSDGGHNGWKSVLEHLDDEPFWRVRIGAGVYEQHPEKRQQQPPMDEYVLQRLPKEDADRINQLIDRLVPDLIGWLERGELEEETLHI